MPSKIEKQRWIPELYDLKHHPQEHKRHADYNSNLVHRRISPVLLGNPTLKIFIDKINDLMVLLYDYTVEIRNWYNPVVDKHWNGHNN